MARPAGRLSKAIATGSEQVNLIPSDITVKMQNRNQGLETLTT